MTQPQSLTVAEVPHLHSQWDVEKNAPLSSGDVTIGSGKKVWWVCDLGHSWQATIASRSKSSRGCPYCCNQKILPGFNDLATTHPDLAVQWDDTKNSVPAKSVGAGSGKKAWWKCNLGHSWEATVAPRAKRGVGCPYCSGKKVLSGFNDLATTYPEIAKQWDEKKNEMSSSSVLPGSNMKAWWKCDMGHSFEMFIYNRTSNRPQSCPYCSGKKVLPGFNDLATTHPEIAKQWDAEKNNLKPTEVNAGSGKKIWWVCDNGHQWETSVLNRKSGSGCPMCAGQKVQSGVNDLGTLHPDISRQWKSDKNDTHPSNVSPGSQKPVWWVCDLGHEWKTSPSNRTRNKSGCPYCSGNKVLLGFNDLLTVSPDIAQQWDDEKNEGLTPDMVTSGSGERVWWVCKNGHSWQSRVADRKRFGCPKCSHSTSRAERELAQFVSQMAKDTAVETSCRSVIPPYELDIYIPEKNIAIEFNGLYWHSEACIEDTNYHYNKWKMCADQGIQLITVWEDEWRDKQEIVKSMLAHKLGFANGSRVYARNTSVSRLESPVAREFLELNHIQGSCFASTHFGLYDSFGELIAVSSWRKNKNTLYLERYATSCSVVGGMGKLLKQGEQYARECGCLEIVTFSDRQVSNGELYRKLGFYREKELAPDYRYLVNGKRKHKFGYRLKRFINDPDLLYISGMTERELALLNGLERIWDCGKTRWVIDL